MTILIWVAAPAILIAGMCLFGIGFGITQNATFALMIDRAPVSGYGTASALWNLAYDAGYGAGPAVFGVFVVYTGYPAAFALTGMLMLAALYPPSVTRQPTATIPLANLSGGVIIIGVCTARAESNFLEVATELRPVPASMLNVDQYHSVIREQVHPAVEFEVSYYLAPGHVRKGYQSVC